MSISSRRIVSIVYTPREVARRPQDRYARVPLERAVLREFHGIEGDLKGGTNDRQLNIMLAETLDELRAEGFSTEPGQMGEQIIISGIPPEELQPQVRLRLGTATVEVTIPRTGCARFETIQDKPRQSATNRLGVLARVVAGGEIAVGDAVEVLPPTIDG